MTLYLGGVLAAFTVFAATLIGVSIWSKRGG